MCKLDLSQVQLFIRCLSAAALGFWYLQELLPPITYSWNTLVPIRFTELLDYTSPQSLVQPFATSFQLKH